MINRSNIKYIDSLGATNKANCWGSTQYALGFIKEPIWQDQKKMDEFLKFNTVKCFGERKQGDIMVMRDKNRALVHTAIYDSHKTWWHKPGSRRSELALASKIKEQYQDDWEIIEYRRFTSLHLVGGKIEVKQRNLVLDLYDGFVKLMGAAWF